MIHFVGSKYRDHLINWKVSFSDKLPHDLLGPELWKGHKDQSATSALCLGESACYYGSMAQKQVLVFFPSLA